MAAARPDVVAGRFALCDPIAWGGSGTVWRAWDLRRERYCAAKVMRQRDSADALRWVREQRLRLDHPHLLTPYSWAAEDEHVVVASPLATGGSLHTLLGDYGPPAPDVVADLLDQLLSGLAHVHAAGVVHRDVTPANLLLDATEDGPRRPLLRLGDFGIAVRTGEPRMTEAGSVLGTPGFVAPEALEGAAPAPAADLYAAGQVGWALLGAEPGTRPDLGDVPAPLATVIAALSARDPADRPASADEARRALAPVHPATDPRTTSGEPLVVLHQLPPLPPPWTPPRPPLPTAHPPRPAPPEASPPETGPAGRVAGGDPVSIPPPGAGPAVSEGTQRIPRVAPTAEAAEPSGPGPEPAGRPGRRRRVVGVAVAVVLAGGGAAGIVALGDRGGPGSPVQPSDSPSVPPPVIPAAAGDPCAWQQEGDLATASDGRTVTCVQVGDGYRWQVT